MQRSGIQAEEDISPDDGAHLLVLETGKKEDCNTACERSTAAPCLSGFKLSTLFTYMLGQQTMYIITI